MGRIILSGQETRRAITCHEGSFPLMASQPNPSPGKRLDSWKEIAAFLGRAERTVKRWEDERGLPVHRVPGGGRSAVFAYTEELAGWLKGKTEELEADDSTSSGAVASAVATATASDAASPPPAQPEIAPDRVPAKLPSRWGAARIAAWLVPLGLTAGLIFYFSVGHNDLRVKALTDTPAAPTSLNLAPDSVAVLPFANDHADPASDYLSDGITESLIGSLARIPQLKIRSRDSVFRFKGKDIEVRRAGADLGVSVVVSGRVLQQGDSIEVRAEMTNVRENTEIWGHRYSGKTSDLVKLQEQLAGDVAEKLASSLSASDRQRIVQQGTENTEADSLYLKGRYAWNKRTFPELQSAVSYFNQALAKDPTFALAYSGLADAYSVMHNFGGNPAEEVAKSNAAARKAMELDPTLARPHAVLAMNEFTYDWDFTGSEAEFKRAIELDPNDATAHQWYAETLSATGRHQEALAEINRAHDLDPLSPVIARVMGGNMVDAGEYDQGIAICKQLVQENPTFAIAHDCLVYAYWGKHMYADAVEEWKIEGQLNQNPDDIKFTDALEKGFRSSGWKGAMTAAASVFEERRKNGYASAFQIARFYADAGDRERAFRWLDLAFREHDGLLLDLNISPGLDNIRSDPRFADLVRKVGLPAAH